MRLKSVGLSGGLIENWALKIENFKLKKEIGRSYWIDSEV